MRKKIAAWEPKPLQMPEFTTGQVAKVLKVEVWRIQKLLDVESYGLSPTGQLGRGRGSRRTFSRLEVYRLAVAVQMLQDGFTPEVVVEALRTVEEQDVLEFDAEGNSVGQSLFLKRTDSGGHSCEACPSVPVPKAKDIYYVLDVGDLADRVDERITELKLAGMSPR